MERLTKYIFGYAHGAEGANKDNLTGNYCRGKFEATAIVDRLAAYEDTGLEPEQASFAKNIIEDAFSGKPEFTERLRELAQGDWLIGRTVYYPHAGKVLEKRVSHFTIYDEQRANLPPKESWFCIDNDDSETFGFEDIGKTVFLTREAAEEAMKAREQE